MENRKLEKEELDIVKQIRTNNRLILEELGSISLAQIDLDAREVAAKKILETVREDEAKFTANLEKKYGKGTINLETGEFISA
jgi:hypothetical protein